MGTEEARTQCAILARARLALANAVRALPDMPSAAFPQPHVRADVSHPHSRGKWHQCGARAHVKHMAMCAYSTGWPQMRSKHSSTEQLARLAIRTYQLDDVLFVPAAETPPQAEIVQTLALAVETITGVRPR